MNEITIAEKSIIALTNGTTFAGTDAVDVFLMGVSAGGSKQAIKGVLIGAGIGLAIVAGITVTKAIIKRKKNKKLK